MITHSHICAGLGTGSAILNVVGVVTNPLRNGVYTENTSKVLNGKATMWHISNNYFLYWCARDSKFALAVLSSWDQITAGSCHSSASTSGTDKDDLLNAEYWVEFNGGDWVRSNTVSVSVPGWSDASLF
jgi:hypothetical protein